MQYPVPQFTDVEDRIIGSLTLKQFGIVFGAGIILVLVYTSTKDAIITLLFGIIIGLPAVGIAFAKFNGRPLYNIFPVLLDYILEPKFLIFHKESGHFDASVHLKDVDVAPVKQVKTPEQVDPKARLKEVNRLLQQQAERERQLVRSLR